MPASKSDSRLVLFSHGRRRVAPVRAFGTYTGPPNPGLGPGRHGAPIAVYSRCSERFGCDLFSLGLRSGREHKLRSLSTRLWSEGFETGVAVWGRRYLFSRFCLSNTHRCRRGEGLFAAPPLRRISRAQVTGVDLHGRVAAFTPYGSDEVGGADSLWIAYLPRRGRPHRCLITTADGLKAAGRDSASVLDDPVVTKRFIYWAAGPDGSAEETGPSFLLRRRLPTRRCHQRGRIQLLRKTDDYSDIAVTGGRVFYTQYVIAPFITPSGSNYYTVLLEMTDPPVRDP